MLFLSSRNRFFLAYCCLLLTDVDVTCDTLLAMWRNGNPYVILGTSTHAVSIRITGKEGKQSRFTRRAIMMEVWVDEETSCCRCGMNVRLVSSVIPRYVYESVVVIGNDVNVSVCRGGGTPLLLSSDRGGRKKTTLVFLDE